MNRSAGWRAAHTEPFRTVLSLAALGDLPISVGTAGPQPPDRMPDRMSDRMPDKIPEYMPDRMSDKVPDRMPE